MRYAAWMAVCGAAWPAYIWALGACPRMAEAAGRVAGAAGRVLAVVGAAALGLLVVVLIVAALVPDGEDD